MLLKFQSFARCVIGSECAAASAVETSAGPSLPLPAPAMASVSLPDNINDDVLREILLRLPPLPSSLPRASLVCKSWCRLVSDPGFLRRFREHHRTPPLLGYFFSDRGGPIFTPTLAPPNCIPPERFSLPEHPAGERLFFLGCRHGLALLINRRRLQATVWDPVTNRKVTVAYPPEFTTDNGAHCFRGAVLSSAGGDGGYDGHSRPFKTQDRGLGLAILSRLSIQLWGRKADPGGVAGWVLQITVEVDRLLSLPPSMMANVPARILGYDEDSNAIHLATSTGVYAVQLESMQFTELFNVYRISGHPYTSFYTEGWGICAGDNRKEILNSA